MRLATRRRMLLSIWAEDRLFEPHIEAPDDWPEQARLATASIDPLWEGDHASGSSGIYAAVNAIRLATVGHCQLGKRAQRDLLEKGWAWRAQRGHAKPLSGMRVGDWTRMLEALCFAIARSHGQYLTILQPWRDVRPTDVEFLTTLERLIVSNHVVATLFAGAHFTIVKGYTPSSLLLFDSGGRTSVRRRAVALTSSDPAARHRLVASTTLAIRRSN